MINVLLNGNIMEKRSSKNVRHVAKKYGFSYLRVFNWLKRGVPYKVQVEFPDVVRELFDDVKPAEGK